MSPLEWASGSYIHLLYSIFAAIVWSSASHYKSYILSTIGLFLKNGFFLKTGTIEVSESGVTYAAITGCTWVEKWSDLKEEQIEGLRGSYSSCNCTVSIYMTKTWMDDAVLLLLFQTIEIQCVSSYG